MITCFNIDKDVYDWLVKINDMLERKYNVKFGISLIVGVIFELMKNSLDIKTIEKHIIMKKLNKSKIVKNKFYKLIKKLNEV
ncbi:MAG: hypothetical protein QXN68_00790 [Thermoplasmata archaeon]